MKNTILALATSALVVASAARAQNYPAPREGDFVARDFKFHDGSSLPELKLHYRTIGDPKLAPVVILHGSGGSGGNFLNDDFAGKLFGPGQPLDARAHFIILPDAIGAGGSSKPSDGMRMKFPRYDYADMVNAQHLLLREGIGLNHVNLVMGNSMGGMHTWLWGEMYPKYMDALAPMAATPGEMSSRNWMTRRLLIEAIKSDPGWNGGNYEKNPTQWKFANVYFGLTTSGGSRGYAGLASTRIAADKMIEDRLAAPPPGDANDTLYQFDAARDYNPTPDLEKIEAALLAINSADDERNPPELGIMEAALKRVKNGRVYLIPGSAETRGHGTTGMAKFYAAQLGDFLAGAAKRE